MKTTINTLFGAGIALLGTLGLTPDAAAQDERIVFYGPVTETFRVRGQLTETTTHQILSMNADGSDVRQITYGDDHSYFPRWSPNKEHVLFYQGDTEYGDPIYVMNSDGTKTFKVADEHYAKGADWSPDGTMICYVGEDADPGPEALFVVEVDPYAKGKKKVGTPVVLVGDGSFWNPTWSHGGNRIAYSKWNRLTVLDLTSGIETQLAGMSCFAPAWSPDDAMIAFVGYETGSGNALQLFITNADFSGMTQLTNFDESVHSAYYPSWSADGTQIVFRVEGAEGSRSLYKLTLATDELTLLQNGADYPDWNP